jgi:hypothetical protein
MAADRGMPHGHGDDHPRGAETAGHLHRGVHRRPGRQPVVDQNHRASGHGGRGAAGPVEPLAPGELDALLCGDPGHLLLVQPQLRDQLLREHPNLSARDRPHRELLLPRHTQLAHEQGIERGVERASDLGGDRHSAPRKAEDRDVRRAPVAGESLRQPPTRVAPVTKPHRRPPGRSAPGTFPAPVTADPA